MSIYKVGDKIKIIKGRMAGELAKVIGKSNLNMEHIIIVRRNQGRKRVMGFKSHYLMKWGNDMSKFTEMWRVKHSEPLTYNERIINSACDIIERQEEIINYVIGGIDALVPLQENEEAKKDMQAIKETLEKAFK